MNVNSKNIRPVLATLLSTDNSQNQTPALVWKTGQLSHHQLQQAVRRRADWLTQQGCEKGSRIVICLSKGPVTIEYLFAVLAIGAIAVPVNPRVSNEYLHKILLAIEPALLLVEKRGDADSINTLKDKLPFTFKPCFEDAINHLQTTEHISPQSITCKNIKLDDVAIILTTSGTTGEPKGIQLTHANVSCFVDWAMNTFKLSHADKFISIAPLHFDLSILDIFASQQSGASVYLLNNIETTFPATISQILDEQSISVVYAVPTLLQLLSEYGSLENKKLAQLRLILFAGEVFPVPALRKLMKQLPNSQFANLYGPTETNVVSFYQLEQTPVDDKPLPLGKICKHVEIGIVNKKGAALGVNETGEICVFGVAVMHGYWRKPEITDLSRVAGRRDSYRTGDMGYLDEQGLLHFLGREDQQVKIRGVRIDIAAVENIATGYHEISQAAATISRPDECEAKLILHVIPLNINEFNVSRLQKFLSEHLPQQSLPDVIKTHETFPLSLTHKLDRKKLEKL